MRLVLEQDPQILTVRSYTRGEVVVGDERLQAPFIVSADRLIRDWPVRSAGELDFAALGLLLELQPQVILIGADAGLTPGAPWRSQLLARHVAVECMDLGAACRTYNVLAQERRAVVAGLFP
jgi:uncharacterized protein